MSYGAIYKITNRYDGKIYIGKSKDPKKIAKLLKEKLKWQAETYWIWLYDSFNNGYNKSYGDGLRKTITENKGSKMLGIIISTSFNESIEKYCDKVSQNKSDYIRGLIRDDLIEKGIIKLGGKQQWAGQINLWKKITV